MKIDFKNIIYLPIIGLFLPSFAFYFPLTKGVYLYFYLSIYINLFLILYKQREDFIKFIFNIHKKTPLKIFTISVFFIILNSIFLSYWGYTTIPKIFLAIVLKFILCIYPILLFFTYVIDRFFSLEKFLKIFSLLFWIMLIIGFITYLADFFNIVFINNIIDFIANARLLEHQFITRGGLQAGHYFTNGIPRLDGLFTEPAFYARFLFLFLPLAYYISFEKNYRIISNTILNKIIKKTFLPFTWISILLTQSPIYLILSLVLTFIIFYKKIFKILKSLYMISIIAFFFIAIIALINTVNFENTYLIRILNVFKNINSFEDFIMVEPSLGSRIVCFYNSILLFLKHPLTGVGLGNIHYHMFNQMVNSPIITTNEIKSSIYWTVISGNRFAYNRALLYHILSSHGILITIMLSYFHFKIYFIISNIQRKIILKTLNEDFAAVLKNCWLALTILIFYSINSDCYELWFLYALFVSYIYSFFKHNKKGL